MAKQAVKVRAEPTPKRIRAAASGTIVLDSIDVLLVWEHDHYPQYYVPESDLTVELEPSGSVEPDPGFGTATRLDMVTSTGRRVPGAAWRYDQPEILAGRVRFEWDVMNAWFEEDETVYVHPRSPYVRVDCLRSSREVRIEVDKLTVANSSRTVFLFETGLPPRIYVPPTDVRLDVLRESDTITHCPYKGTANHLHVVTERGVKKDLVWYYASPRLESAPIAGMLAFHQERCKVYVDGKRQRAEGR